MIRVILHGAAGKMGREVEKAIRLQPEQFSLSALVDPAGGAGICPSLADCPGAGDLIIDFSHHSTVSDLLNFACRHRLPLVLGTTGHTREELELIRSAAGQIPIFHTGNFSVGVALLAKLAEMTARVFPDCDVEIVETHHRQKADAPSGTALMLAGAVQKARPDTYNVFGRSGMGKRDPKEIGIHAVRRGMIVGEHQMLFSTDAQTVTLTHTAHSRSLFAEGALAAARFLPGHGPGLYDMQDLLAD